MKSAMASRAAVGALALLTLAALAGEVQAQPRVERGPDAVAPNLGRRPEPLPPGPQRERQAPEAEAPSTSEDFPPAARGCPDQGRKLELIV